MSIRVTVTARKTGMEALKQKLRADLIDLHGGLVLKSPVDQGDFRRAWTVDTVAMTIENNTEYAEALADGHSSQAPKGWVEAELDRVFKH